MIFTQQEFYCIRHGQTDWNLKHTAMGSKNMPLNQASVEQAHEAKKLMHGYEFNSIANSSNIKCRELNKKDTDDR